MNKRGIVMKIVFIIMIFTVGFFWFIGEWSFDNMEKEKCVHDRCCHANGCIWESDAANCSGTFCTMECRAGTMDCGAGHCEVIDGECEVVWDE